ncbi:MAG: hypothetical protein JWR61_2391 [Ferruginibacter sp.]|uniref:hypothetical protein n=1 Tax=Ferruginibacter sp. TaxID=1940288 RepID=UPI00265A54E2|nr:hypothetical protein [Ferruginibacter sp.]MDB5277436.1 hypothetical protein [Ferruginibacter sp.]
MTSKKLLIALLSGICFFFSSLQKITAQHSDSVNTFYTAALHNAREVYHQAFGDQRALTNGSLYTEYPYKFNEGDPYFGTPAPASGSVFYDGVQFDNVLMRYNEITDELVINYYADKIQLLKPKIDWFHFYGSDFIKITKDSLSMNLVSSGFYNRLYNGKIGLFKKEIKTIQQNSSAITELLTYIEESDYYYLKRADRYFIIKSKSDLYKLLSDRKKEVKSFIKQHGLNFKKDKQNTLTQSIAFYDSLIK